MATRTSSAPPPPQPRGLAASASSNPAARATSSFAPSPASPHRAARNLYVSSLAYNVLTLTDGAIRIIVLLFFVQLGFSAISLALMFSLYELMGVVTNLGGGVLGSKLGMRWLVLTSLALQLACVVMLIPIESVFPDLDPNDSPRVVLVTVYVVFAQGMSGCSKDLMKIQGKSVPKLCTKPDDEDRLFRVVSVLTGMKNSLKGFGYFLGALLLWQPGWIGALAIQGGLLAAVVPPVLLWMESDLGIAAGDEAATTERATCAVFRKGWNVNVLSGARFFLFGSRDVWFEVAAPYFFRKVLDWAPYSVGLFMGGYIVVYGQLQVLTSELFSKKRGFKRIPNRGDVWRWAAVNAVETLALGVGAYFAYQPLLTDGDAAPVTATLIAGIFVFAALFAVNSAVHSYLIVSYSNKDKVSQDVGFYYMSNAGGRFVGTLASGFIYTYTFEEFGLSVCLWVATACLVTAAGISTLLRDTPRKPENTVPLTGDEGHGDADAKDDALVLA